MTRRQSDPLNNETVRRTLEAANVTVSLKMGDAQIRAGIALFNDAEEIDRLLHVTGAWR